MITKFKLYEGINEGLPEIGDYAITIYDDQFKNQIGKIKKFINVGKNDSIIIYRIEFTKPIKAHFDYILNEIEFFSKDIKDLEAIIASRKYNL